MSPLNVLLRSSAVVATLLGLSACGGGGEATPESPGSPTATALGVSAASAPVPEPVAFETPVEPFQEPDADPFYAPPSLEVLKTYPPGAVIRYREIRGKAFYVLPTMSKAWQVLYRSNDSHGEPIANGAAVLVPPNAPATGRKLLSYQAASDALTRRCAPSFTVLNGTAIEAVLIAPTLASTGWVTVLPDYEGPQSQWMAGKISGQGVLDGIRAAENLKPAGLDGAATPTMLWGYSGGAFATAWAAELHGTYAPELNIKGSAAGGAPASVEATARFLQGTPIAGIVLAAAVGLDRAFPEMEIKWNDAGEKMKKNLANTCAGGEMTLTRDPLFAGYHFKTLSDFTVEPNPLDDPKIKAVLDQQRLGFTKPKAPIYYFQGTLDEVTPIGVADQVVKRYCDMGATVLYDRVFGEHASALFGQFPKAIGYLMDRAKDFPAPTSCR